MFGKLLSEVVKIATLPIDVVEIGLDTITGGDGDRENLKEVSPLPLVSDLRDEIADVIKKIDE